MKYKIQNYIICGIIILNLVSCGKKTQTKSVNKIESKTELKNEKTKEKESEFTYSSADIVKIILENDAEFLVVGEPTEIYLKKKNLYKRLSKFNVERNKSIDLNGPNIDTSGLLFKLTATEENLLEGNIEILLTERTESGEDFIHKILIPVKKQTE